MWTYFEPKKKKKKGKTVHRAITDINSNLKRNYSSKYLELKKVIIYLVRKTLKKVL